ncbi:SRPBCC domain-containing protein [Brevibacterium album]|uniref:SRPBCC domain-containing protein n=1 Tax=Brevibacterium album TaxID=417948 RepID=UPI00040267F3|nr:SRPBCC domain-containing protein [Brevibacterium album]
MQERDTTTAPKGAGTLGVSGDGVFRIHFDRHLAHPVEKVWTALTDDRTRAVWLDGVRIDARPGGTVAYDFGEEGTATGEVLSVHGPSADDPAAELVHTWQWEGVPDSVVTWRLEGGEGGTRLQLTHSELVREPARDFAVGWHIILDSADLHLSGGDPGAAWEAYEEVAGHYAA